MWFQHYIFIILIVGKNFGFEIFSEKFGKEELEKRLKNELIVSGPHFSLSICVSVTQATFRGNGGYS